jgi:hypothetical protein
VAAFEWLLRVVMQDQVKVVHPAELGPSLHIKDDFEATTGLGLSPCLDRPQAEDDVPVLYARPRHGRLYLAEPAVVKRLLGWNSPVAGCCNHGNASRPLTDGQVDRPPTRQEMPW